MSNVIFKDVPGYEGLYQASSDGKVWSLTYKGKQRTAPKELSQTFQVNGYLKVTLCRDGVHHVWNVHRIIALTFIPNPDSLSDVDHIGLKTDNSVENLRWMSHTENCGRRRGESNSRNSSSLHLSIQKRYQESHKEERALYLKKWRSQLYTNGVEVIKLGTLSTRVHDGKTTYDQWHLVE